ncbi:MAG TPA: MEDS domain-containing protein [Candidatus Nanoarchaeia archaeon]|nr:MEDS domain-containing protein [Candidatus Nanoarchaeia archaeon]
MPQQSQVLLGQHDLRVENGSHIILLYQDKSELLEFLLNYYVEGLKKNDLCFMVNATEQIVKEIRQNAERVGISAQRFQDNMVFLDYKDLYFNGGKFDAGRVYKKIDELIRKNPSRRIRTCGDMTWFDSSNFNDLDRYETGLSERYNSNNLVLMCAYFSSQLTVEQIIKIIQSHTKIVFKEKGTWKVSETVERKIYEEKIEELEKFSKITVDRELKMIELKNKIAELERELRENKNNPK